MTSHDPNVILVASAPRSGSSMTTNLLTAAGCFAGNLKPADRYNRRGYFENRWFARRLALYLQQHDALELGKRYQPVGLDAPMDHLRRDLFVEMIDQGWDGVSPIVLKNTKLPLCWRAVNHQLPNAKWVFVIRDRDNVLSSIRRTPFMNAYDTSEEWGAFLAKYARLGGQIVSTVRNWHVFNTSAFMAGDSNELTELLEFGGFDISEADRIIDEVIDREAWQSSST